MMTLLILLLVVLELRAASKYDPLNFIPHAAMGKLYTIKGDHESAFRERDRVVRMVGISKRDAAAYHHRALAELQREKPRYENALADAEQCLDYSNRQNWQPWFTRGTVLLQMKRTKEALSGMSPSTRCLMLMRYG
jgi:tetratricopeptide (TPR) repeat protein